MYKYIIRWHSHICIEMGLNRSEALNTDLIAPWKHWDLITAATFKSDWCSFILTHLILKLHKLALSLISKNSVEIFWVSQIFWVVLFSWNKLSCSLYIFRFLFPRENMWSDVTYVCTVFIYIWKTEVKYDHKWSTSSWNYLLAWFRMWTIVVCNLNHLKFQWRGQKSCVRS